MMSNKGKNVVINLDNEAKKKKTFYVPSQR